MYLEQRPQGRSFEALSDENMAEVAVIETW